jgi:integrase
MGILIMSLYRLLATFSKKWMPVNDWLETYVEILGNRSLRAETVKSRMFYVAHIREAIGEMPIGKVMPIDISRTIREIWDSGRQSCARRVLIEMRDVFSEAVAAGIVFTNPAIVVKSLPYRVARSRLSFELWQQMLATAEQKMPRWVPLLLKLGLITGQRRSDVVKMRFTDVWDGYLHVEQQKTGARIALPLALTLEEAGLRLGDVIEECRSYGAKPGATLLRKHSGRPYNAAHLTNVFRQCLRLTLGHEWDGPGTPPSEHEMRSLAARMQSLRGINAQTLLGHKHSAMTDAYKDDRGLNRDQWNYLELIDAVNDTTTEENATCIRTPPQPKTQPSPRSR